MRFHKNISNGFRADMSTWWKCSKGNNSKSRQPETWFMCSSHRLMMLYICVKFRENISNGIRVTEQTRNYEALMDGRTDTQNHGRYNIIPCHFLWWSIKTGHIWNPKHVLLNYHLLKCMEIYSPSFLFKLPQTREFWTLKCLFWTLKCLLTWYYTNKICVYGGIIASQWLMCLQRTWRNIYESHPSLFE